MGMKATFQIWIFRVGNNRKLLCAGCFKCSFANTMGLNSLWCSAAEPDPFFLCSTWFWAQFQGSNRSAWSSGTQNWSNRVRLTSKRVQIRVQHYNVLNLNPIRFQVGPSGSKVGLSRVDSGNQVMIIQKWFQPIIACCTFCHFPIRSSSLNRIWQAIAKNMHTYTDYWHPKWAFKNLELLGLGRHFGLKLF